MRALTSICLRAVLASTALLSVAGCGGGGGGSGGANPGGGGTPPIGVPIPITPPILSLNYGVVARASFGADGFTGNWGGQGTTGALARKNGEGDYTVTFYGSYPGLTSVNDVTVFAAAEHTTRFHVASASMDEGSASGATIVVHVLTYSTFTFPNTRADAAFSVMVTRGMNALGVAGFANIEGEWIVPNILSFGGNETTAVYSARNSLGRYTVKMEGNYPGATSMDDFTVLVAINDDDYLEIASASIDGGSADSTHVTFQVSAWSTIVAPPVLVDTSFSVMILRRGTTPPGIRGFASINGDVAAPSVVNFGGGQTTSVSVTQPIYGFYTVTFTGNYTGVVNADNVSVLAAVSDDDNYNVVSVGTVTASATTIVVTLWSWSTMLSPNFYEGHDFSIVIPR